MLEFIFRKDQPEIFWRIWESLINAKESGPRYLKNTIDSHILISKFRNNFYSDESFIILKDKKPVAGVFLPIEKKGGISSIALGGAPIIAPLIIDGSIESEIFDKIDQVAREKNVAKIYFYLDPLDQPAYNYLQKYNYLDFSLLTFVIDLGVPDLFKACRENHRRNIKKILKNKDFKVFFIDEKKYDKKIHEDYCSLHHKCSGRITRPEESFDLQFDNLKKNRAVLFGLEYKGRAICFNYFEYNFDKAIYFSGADDPEFSTFPLYHVLIFSAMDYLKSKGIRYVDLGQPSSPSIQFNYYPDKKQQNIVLFKRGFPGDFKQSFCGLRYFSEIAFLEDQKEFTNQFLKN